MLYPFRDQEARRGYIDEGGKIVVQPTYEMGGIQGEFWEDRAEVYLDGMYGYIDLEGRLAIPLQYDGSHPFSGGRAWVRRGHAWGLIDQDGNELCGFDYWAEQTEGFCERSSWLALVAGGPSPRKYGFVDRDGAVAIPFEHDYAGAFREERAGVRTSSGFGFIAPDGQVVIEPQFARASRFSEGLASVARVARPDEYSAHIRLPGISKPSAKGRGGDPRDCYIDRAGAVVFEHDFAAALPFASGRAAVQRGKKWGYIDRTGATVIAPQYKEASDFLTTGVALVRDGRRWRLIDRDENAVGSETFANHYFRTSFDDTLLCVEDRGLWGFVNCQGEYEIPPRFTDSECFHHGLAYVGEQLGNRLRTGYINRAGEYIFTLDLKL